jgi:hypothetical protein
MVNPVDFFWSNGTGQRDFALRCEYTSCNANSNFGQECGAHIVCFEV